MKKALIPVVFLCLPAVSSLRADITFDFDALASYDFTGLSFADHDVPISAYMSGVYGSSVETIDAVFGNADPWFVLTFGSAEGWPGWDGTLEIIFDEEPITGVQFRGKVWEMRGADFHLRAYDQADQLVGVYVWSPDDEIFSSGWIDFPSATPVRRLEFSDGTIHAIFIDDLTVRGLGSAVPSPGAVVLTVLGLGILTTAVRVWVPRRSRSPVAGP
ncbi:MAG: hypothetical protein JXQ75_01200 [Phycisphaerae bacterium]|nr:hypothetical protein [Phycisphaerae bacterium]